MFWACLFSSNEIQRMEAPPRPASSRDPLRREKEATMHSASPVSISSQVTMSVRLPEGWEPPFLLVFFPLCIPSPIAGYLTQGW